MSTIRVVKKFNKEEYSSVADYYNGKSIFITGGTGFVGKMYIQKILYSCPGIDKIYMLIRASSTETAKHRITQMIENSLQLFSQLREERPLTLLKLVPVVGDLSDPNLRINPEDELLLREEVSIVVHSAATINLHDLLQDAFKVNVTGTQNVLDLAKRMKKLQAFVHMSTTFCAMYSNTEFIEEIVYPPPINLNDIPKIRNKYGHMRSIPCVLGDHWNPYSFTKAISENVILLNHGDLLTAIIRPSMIGNAYKEPYKGWLDVMNLHSFILYAISNGHIRVLNMDKNTVWDFIPVDYVANLMILAATKCKRSTDVDVYNCGTSSINPVRISTAISIFISYFVNNNSNQIPFPFVLYLKSKDLYDLLLQSTPDQISDLISVWRAQKPNLFFSRFSVKLHNKIREFNDDITFYGSRSWKAKSDRAISLIRTLSDEDKKTFPCDPTDIDWMEYFQKYSEAFRKFSLKKKYKL